MSKLISMVRIPAGEFLMGSPEGEEGRWPDEAQHLVTISRPFLIGQYPVTRSQWALVMEEDYSHQRPNHPQTGMSWFDAALFCNVLSRMEGLEPTYTLKGDDMAWNREANGYRLPTEAEWEYAARAGTTTRFWSGVDEADLARVGWYDMNSDGKAHPVSQKPANPWGLYDVHGNVWEWCWDWYDEYQPGEQRDPTGPKRGAIRVARGGFWGSSFEYIRVAYHYGGAPGGRYADLSFRLARNGGER